MRGLPLGNASSAPGRKDIVNVGVRQSERLIHDDFDQPVLTQLCCHGVESVIQIIHFDHHLPDPAPVHRLKVLHHFEFCHLGVDLGKIESLDIVVVQEP